MMHFFYYCANNSSFVPHRQAGHFREAHQRRPLQSQFRFLTWHGVRFSPPSRRRFLGSPEVLTRVRAHEGVPAHERPVPNFRDRPDPGRPCPYRLQTGQQAHLIVLNKIFVNFQPIIILNWFFKYSYTDYVL